MSRVRLVVGIFVMGIAVPVTVFLLLRLETFSQMFTIAAATFISWGVADLLSSILERPRLKGHTPGRALKDELERRTKE